MVRVADAVGQRPRGSPRAANVVGRIVVVLGVTAVALALGAAPSSASSTALPSSRAHTSPTTDPAKPSASGKRSLTVAQLMQAVRAGQVSSVAVERGTDLLGVTLTVPTGAVAAAVRYPPPSEPRLRRPS